MMNGIQARENLFPDEDDQSVEPGPELVAPQATQSRAPSWRPEKITHDTASASPPVDLDSLTRWTKDYFESCNPATSLLHGPEEAGLFEEFALSGIVEYR